MLYPFLYKRKSFEHEKEIRAIYLELPPAEKEIIYLNQEAPHVGICVDIDIIELIETICLSPSGAMVL